MKKTEKHIDFSEIGQNIDIFLHNFDTMSNIDEECEDEAYIHTSLIHKLDSYDNYSMKFK